MNTTTSPWWGASLVAALALASCAQQPSEPAANTDPVTPAATSDVGDSVQPPPATDVAPRRWRWRQANRDRAPHAGWAFDPAAVETIEGEIREVVLTPARGRRGGGVHLVVETAGGPLTVALGPAWYVEKQEPALAAGDAIVVTGARVDDALVVAVKVRVGSDVLVLRSDDGIPQWQGWRRGRGRRGS
jgi:hypothetical protein